MLLRTILVAAVLTASSAAPALAQEQPFLDSIKPCYVVANETQREPVAVSGHFFTPFAYVDIFIDDIVQPVTGNQPQVDLYGLLSGSVFAPYIDEGQRVFTLRVTERGANPKSAIAPATKVTRLSVEQTPTAAATSQRVRFRGRGFTDLTRPIYVHYVFAGKSKKTVELGLPTGDCGLFSVRRKQFPFKKSPQRGVWTLQFDQEERYNPKASPRVPLTIKVQRKIKPKRARGR
jgi:hypothetical protein